MVVNTEFVFTAFGLDECQFKQCSTQAFAILDSAQNYMQMFLLRGGGDRLGLSIILPYVRNIQCPTCSCLQFANIFTHFGISECQLKTCSNKSFEIQDSAQLALLLANVFTAVWLSEYQSKAF